VPHVGICPATLMIDPLAAGATEVGLAGGAGAGAGFADASVWIQHLPALEGSGLKVRVVEAALAWANGDARATEHEARAYAEAAAAQGADIITAICLDPAIADRERARDNLGRLVAAAESVGARVAVEFLPWTAIADLATAWDLVGPLGPAAGILLDTWHWVRQPGGPAWELLASIPGERISYVQMCDAGPEPSADVMDEALTGRLLPGEGVVDFARLFAALAAIGASPYLATEIFNPSLVERLGGPAAAAAMKSAAEAVTPEG
jgi:sugar phosphate isomerase/epimerase